MDSSSEEIESGVSEVASCVDRGSSNASDSGIRKFEMQMGLASLLEWILY